MRIWAFLIFLFTFAAPLPLKAETSATCAVTWDVFRQTEDRSSTEKPVEKNELLLIAVTLSPSNNVYLYGPESTDGLPTQVQITVEPQGQEAATALVNAPPPILQSKTRFSKTPQPGNSPTKTLIYEGPVVFVGTVPLTELETKITIQVSGLLCTATNCTMLSKTESFVLSVNDIRKLPVAPQKLLDQAFLGVSPKIQAPSPSDASPKDIPQEAVIDFNYLTPHYFNLNLEVEALGSALFFGLLAGILLNLMPCVLPVVSLKFSALMAVSAMTNKRKQAKAFRNHCLIFAAGVITWFLFLALMLGLAGWAWGELFQNSIIICVLGLILFLLGLSLFGVFSLPIFDLKISSESNPHWQAFASGLLATLLATPCSGPLLGGVLGWALRQPLPTLTMTVASVGVGMALPYGIMAFFPKLVHLVPRPGAWTLRLEQLLGFFLMASVVYLITLLPSEWIAPFLMNLFAIAFAAWLWGQIGHLGASFRRRAIAKTLAVLTVLLAIWWGISSINTDTAWENFTQGKFEALLGKEPLLLEFTADWCPSCKALEHTTLNERRMAKLRDKYKMRLIRVDMTRDDDVKKELLKSLGSSSIPVLAIFPAGTNATSPLVLRDLITPAQLKSALSSKLNQ